MVSMGLKPRQVLTRMKETIIAAVKIISDDLLSRTTTNIVNVYFTGESIERL